VRAEHVVDVLEAQAGGGEAVEPRLLWEVERRRITLVLAGAGVDQNGVLGRAHQEGLIGDHHAAGGPVEHLGVHGREMALADLGIVADEHVLRLPPRPVPFDEAGDGDVADGELFHDAPCPMSFVGRNSEAYSAVCKCSMLRGPRRPAAKYATLLRPTQPPPPSRWCRFPASAPRP